MAKDLWLGVGRHLDDLEPVLEAERPLGNIVGAEGGSHR